MTHMRRIVTVVGIIAATSILHAQPGWVPTRIVAITDYTPLGRQARISGDVVIRCFLSSAGSVVKAEVLSGHPILKEQARENALLWKFQRTASTQEGTDSVTLKYQYRLEGEPQHRGRTSFLVDLPNVIQIVAPVAELNP